LGWICPVSGWKQKEIFADAALEAGGILQWDERDIKVTVRNGRAGKKEGPTAMQTLLETTE